MNDNKNMNLNEIVTALAQLIRAHEALEDRVAVIEKQQGTDTQRAIEAMRGGMIGR